MTRHHAEPNINILLTRNLPSDSGIRQWSHPLMIPLYCLWAKSNSRTCGKFECDVTFFCFCFDFVCSNVRCVCSSIVCLRFQVQQSQTRLMSWYWKRNPTWRKGLITYNSHLGLSFLLIDWLSLGEGKGSFEIGRLTSREWKNSGRRWTRG